MHHFLGRGLGLGEARKTVPINQKIGRGRKGSKAQEVNAGTPEVCGKERESDKSFPFDKKAKRRKHEAGRGRASRTHKTIRAVKRKERLHLSKDVVKRRSAKVKN